MSLYKGTTRITPILRTETGGGTQFQGTAENLIGTVDNNGLYIDSDNYSLVFTGVKTVTEDGKKFRYRFLNDKALTSVSFPDLETVVNGDGFYSAFEYCTNLANISFPKLTKIEGWNCFTCAFKDCTGLTTVDFPLLADLNWSGSCLNNAFENCTSLTSVSFPALDTGKLTGDNAGYFNNMLSGITGCTVHFPASCESTLSNWDDVTNGFGGTNTTVLFDL